MAEDKSAGVIRFDAVEIDLDAHRLRVGGQVVPLEPKAFAVLALLVRHPGHVMMRDQILDAVWGHSHVTPGVLNRIVTLLRQALGEDRHQPRWLHTVHGVGYRLDLPAATSTADGVDSVDAAACADGLDGVEIAADAEPAELAAPAAAPVTHTAPPADARVASAAAPQPQPTPATMRRRWPLRFTAGAVAALLALAFAGWRLRPAPPPVTPAPPSPAAGMPASQSISVAVLPLVNATGDSDQQFFADGISASLIDALTQYEGLKVIGRGAAFHFRDSNEDVKSIGAQLGVTHLVGGSVQRDADHVRIGVELVRSSDGTAEWSQRFDRPYADLFALQDEVALAVAGALQVKLMRAMPYMVKGGRPASGNLRAYEAYLHGTYFMGNGARHLAGAIEEFTRATQLDPGYAQAWAWLGHARTLFAYGNEDRAAAHAGYAQARVDIDTALRLQPGLGQAHAIRANWLRSAQHDWNGALAEFDIALSQVPADDPSHGAHSLLLTALGRVHEAIAEREKYIEGDPLEGFPRIYLMRLQASLGRLDDADANLRLAVQLDPDNTEWHASERSYLAVLRGDAQTAIAEARRMTSGVWRDRSLALALQIGADRAAADAALEQLLAGEGRAGNALAIARTYALRGDAQQAFTWLQRDWERAGNAVQSVLVDPFLLRFRDDPRFAEYCRQAGLPAPATSEALSLDRIREVVAVRH